MKTFVTFLLSIMTFVVYAQGKAYTLEECVLIALDKNISIKQSEINLEGSKIDKSDAMGNFLPQLNAQSQHIWNSGLSQNITTGLIENLTTQFSSFGANVGVTIFNGRQNINQLAKANLNLIAGQYELDDMKDDISLFVANAFLQVKFNRELAQVQRYQLELTQKDVKRTQDRISAGVLTRADIYEIEANLAQQEQSLIQAENSYRLSRISLAQLLLITDYEKFDISSEDFEIPISEILLKNPKDIFEKALTFRNDIKLGVTNIEIAKKDIDIAKGTLAPSVSAFYNYNTRISYSDILVQTGNTLEVPVGFVKDNGALVVTQFPERQLAEPLSFGNQFGQNDGHSYGLSLNIPIFNGSAARNNIKRRVLNLERIENQFEQTKLDLENTINQAYNNAEGALKFFQASDKTLIARKQAFEIANNRYEAGVMNSFDFIQAKQRYEIASSDIIRAKYDYIFKLKVLEFYFGLKL